MKMTNRAMIANHNMLDALQLRERSYYEETGRKLLKGNIRATFAIKKNKGNLLTALKPYEEARQELVEEYRDMEAEKKAIDRENELAKAEGRDPRSVAVIMKEGKETEEYMKKLNELLDIEVEVPVHMVHFEEFDGVELDSAELEPFMFMLAE